MDLFSNKPISTSLTGANPLTAPTGNIPGSGILSGIWSGMKNVFGTPSTTSLTAGSTPLLPSVPSTANLPGLAGTMASGIPALPKPTAPPVTPPTPQTGFSNPLSIPVAQADTGAGTTINVNPATSPATTPVTPTSSAVTPQQATQFLAQLQGMQNTLNNLKTGTQGITQNPVKFQTNSDQNATVPSTSLSGSMTASDLMNQQQKGLSDHINGTGTGTPSSDLLKEVLGQLYNSSLYSPDQQSAISQLYSTKSAVQARTLQETSAVQAQQDNGDISKDQAAANIAEIQRRANEDLAYLGVQENTAANSVSALGMNQANQVGALSTLLQGLQPTQVSPGSTLYNPATGVQYQGSGAAPIDIVSTAEKLALTDQQYGTMMTNPDGSVNYQAYYQKAQQFLTGGAMGNGSSSSGSYSNGGTTNTQGSSFSGGTTNTQGSYAGFQAGTPEMKAFVSSPAFAASLPSTVYPSYQQTSTGPSYFDGSKLDSSGLGPARNISRATGVPIIDGQDATAARTTDQAIKNLKLLQENFNALSSNGVGGALWSNVTDPFSGILQTSRGSALATYNTNRDGLLQQIRALAGSSPRINVQELDLANNALPTLSEFNKDTAQTGADKVNTVMGYLNNALSTVIPGYGGQSGAASSATLSQGSSSSNPFAEGSF